MTSWQKTIKYIATAFAVFLIINIFGGIFAALNIFTNIFNKDKGVLDNMQAYEISGNITDLEMKINAAEVIIKTADKFSLESNIKDLKIEEKKNRLVISEPSKRFFYRGNTVNEANITLYIPNNYNFENTDISTGAGKLTIENLSANNLNLNLGAGEAVIEKLYALSKATLEGGAGKMTVNGGSIHNLDFSLGVGQIKLSSDVTGKSEFDCGVGSLKLTLLGNKESYQIHVDKGLGSTSVDGKSIKNNSSVGNGENYIKINGGVGQIDVNFL